ncbi:MAG: DUF4359 domain-containing protein [Vulcanococcus sp.]
MPCPAPLQRLLWILPLAAAAAALALTNPSPAEFEAFAGEQLVEWLAPELCRDSGLPLTVHLLVRDCPALVRSQRGVLGRLAAVATRRYDAGLFSLYVTELGGQPLLPGITLPRVRAFTLAVAGQLKLLQARGDHGLQER